LAAAGHHSSSPLSLLLVTKEKISAIKATQYVVVLQYKATSNKQRATRTNTNYQASKQASKHDDINNDELLAMDEGRRRFDQVQVQVEVES